MKAGRGGVRRTRLDEVLFLIGRAQNKVGVAQRRYVLNAVRNLIAWLAGKHLINTGSATAVDDDSTSYCDHCFRKIHKDEQTCAEHRPPYADEDEQREEMVRLASEKYDIEIAEMKRKGVIRDNHGANQHKPHHGKRRKKRAV